MEIIERADRAEMRGLFGFDSTDTDREVLVKFALWARYFFPQYFKAKDAPFHKDIDGNNLKVYRGKLRAFVDIVFRGGAKTTRTKLFIAFVIGNDRDHKRKYFKVLTKDLGNARQITTDIYNMLITPRVAYFYHEIFQKTIEKRAETMGAFTTATGVKVQADTVGVDQRGDIQEDARPDFIFMDDFETRKTLRSAVETQAIWDNMEEARTGLSKDGGIVYTCNYISERGNVHRLVQPAVGKVVLIVPIKFNNQPMWDAYTMDEINTIEQNADDFAGEYLCLKPDTDVLTPNGWIAISSLRVGDFVVTHLNRKQKVLQVFRSSADNLIDITVNSTTTTITRNHPVLTLRDGVREWVPAGDLIVGDLVIIIPHGKLMV